jgi:hypothetical protein
MKNTSQIGLRPPSKRTEIEKGITMKRYQVVALVLIWAPIANAMEQETAKALAQQVNIVKPFFHNGKSIDAIRQVMDEIEEKNLAYPDYANRKGFIWSDISVETGNPAEIMEIVSVKATQVNGKLEVRKPQSLLNYPSVKSIFSTEILPKMFETVKNYTNLPKKVFLSLYVQRCNESEQMDWHQDPGEDYDPQCDYSMVLMLSDQNDPKYGWDGGEFKIRAGLPEDKYDEKDVQTIVHLHNQAVIFNNKLNSHLAAAVKPKTVSSARDIIVVLLALDKLPKKK